MPRNPPWRGGAPELVAWVVVTITIDVVVVSGLNHDSSAAIWLGALAEWIAFVFMVPMLLAGRTRGRG